MSWWVIGRGSETCCCSTVIALASAVPIHTGSSRWSPLASCSTSTGRKAPDSTPTAITRISRTGLHPLRSPPDRTWSCTNHPPVGCLLPLILRRQGRLRRRGEQISARRGRGRRRLSVYRCTGVYPDRMPHAGTAVLPGHHVGSPHSTDVPSVTRHPARCGRVPLRPARARVESDAAWTPCSMPCSMPSRRCRGRARRIWGASGLLASRG